MANAKDTQTITELTTIYDPSVAGDRKCRAFVVMCLEGSTDTALVSVAGLHKDTEFVPIPAGTERTFYSGSNDIGKIRVKPSSTSCTVGYGAVA